MNCTVTRPQTLTRKLNNAMNKHHFREELTHQRAPRSQEKPHQRGKCSQGSEMSFFTRTKSVGWISLKQYRLNILIDDNNEGCCDDAEINIWFDRRLIGALALHSHCSRPQCRHHHIIIIIITRLKPA